MVTRVNPRRWNGDPPSDVEAARTRLLDASVTCFERSGVARTTVEDIASEAGVHRATVYEYFAGRDGILAETFLREADRVVGTANRHLHTDGPFPRRLVTAILEGIELTRTSPLLGILFQPDAVGQTVPATLASQAWADRVRRGLTVPIEAAVARGEVRGDVPVEHVIDWIVRIAFQVTTEEPTPGRASAEKQLEWFLLPAIRPQSVADGR